MASEIKKNPGEIEKGISRFPTIGKSLDLIHSGWYPLSVFERIYMELTWPIRLRIIAVMSIGVVLLGIVVGSLISPADPQGAITLYEASVKPSAVAACFAMAFLSGLLAFFVAWPLGRELAPLAAPAGLAYLVCKSGNMFSLVIVNSPFAERKTLYSALKWEGLFWLAIVAAGWAGAIVAARIVNAKPIVIPGLPARKQQGNNILSILAAIIVSAFIANLGISVFAQDVRVFDGKVGSVVGQPGTAQIAFAVLVSFGLAAYCAKYFLDVDSIYPVISAAVLIFLVFYWYSSKTDVLSHMVESRAAAFYPRAICAILPIQMLAFAPIGAIAGYWFAVKTRYHQVYKS
jgi:hypothetical protein